MLQKLNIKTSSKVEFLDITGRVREVVESSDAQSGLCLIYVPHTTAGITINEHADPAVVEDIAAQLEKIAPSRDRYRHMEGNSPGHIKSSLMGTSKTVIIENGRLVLGTWQGIFFCEFDGPRSRSAFVKVIPG